MYQKCIRPGNFLKKVSQTLQKLLKGGVLKNGSQKIIIHDLLYSGVEHLNTGPYAVGVIQILGIFIALLIY